MTTVSFTLETTIGAHRYVDRVQRVAWDLGLDVEVRTVGGWFSKTHRVTLRGSRAAVDLVLSSVAAMERALEAA